MRPTDDQNDARRMSGRNAPYFTVVAQFSGDARCRTACSVKDNVNAAIWSFKAQFKGKHNSRERLDLHQGEPDSTGP